MNRISRVARLRVLCTTVLAAATVAPVATAEDPKERCLAAHEAAQLHRRQFEFLAAREKLRFCAQGACPAVVQSDCIDWLGEVERSIPSIVLSARGDEGDLFEVSVSMDGRVVTSHLEGKATDVDPGAHSFRFEARGKPSKEQRVLVNEGEKFKVVSVSWESPKPETTAPIVASPERPTGPRPIPVATYVFGGGAVVGLAGFVAFRLLGSGTKNELSRTCAPFCSNDEVNRARTSFLVADISLAIGAVGLAGAAFVYFTRPEKAAGEPTKSARAIDRPNELRVIPVAGGGVATVGGSF